MKQSAARRHIIAVTGLLLFVCTAPLAAQEIRHFTPDSLTRITAARPGRPFVLGLWSITCSHCQDELALLGRLRRTHPRLDLVLVATDTPEDTATIAATLRRHGLDGAEAWVFADDFGERLRFSIDRRWRGELPRTYLYAPDHTTRALSGRPDPAQLEAWIARHAPAMSRP